MKHYRLSVIEKDMMLRKYDEDQRAAYVLLKTLSAYPKKELIKMKVRGSKRLKVPYLWPGKGLIHYEYTINELLSYYP